MLARLAVSMLVLALANLLLKPLGLLPAHRVAPLCACNATKRTKLEGKTDKLL